MTDYVVDTNVWVTVDKTVAEVNSTAELDCIQTCRAWLRTFGESQDKLVVDVTYRILKEYRDNVIPNGLARQWLNQLESKPRDLKLVEVLIEFDADGFATVPAHLEIEDKNDRKFVAVAVTQNPTPPIIDAADTDWEKEKQLLTEGGIVILELCPDFIQELLARR